MNNRTAVNLSSLLIDFLNLQIITPGTLKIWNYLLLSRSKLEQTDPASLFSCDVDNPLLQVRL